MFNKSRRMYLNKIQYLFDPLVALFSNESNQQTAAETTQLVWNGKINETGYLPIGSYTYKITIPDKYKQSRSNSAQLDVQRVESGIPND